MIDFENKNLDQLEKEVIKYLTKREVKNIELDVLIKISMNKSLFKQLLEKYFFFRKLCAMNSEFYEYLKKRGKTTKNISEEMKYNKNITCENGTYYVKNINWLVLEIHENPWFYNNINKAFAFNYENGYCYVEELLEFGESVLEYGVDGYRETSQCFEPYFFNKPIFKIYPNIVKGIKAYGAYADSDYYYNHQKEYILYYDLD